MRVLLDCRMATWTGIGRYITSLARGLASRDDIDLVIVYDGQESSPVPASQHVRLVPAKKPAFSLTGMRELGKIVESEQPDLTHCTHFPTPLPAPHPLVVTIHDLIPLVVPSSMPSAVKRLAYRILNWRAARVADAIITNSDYTRLDFERFFPAAHGKTIAVHLHVEEFTEGGDGVLPEGLLRPDSRYILSMGNTKPHKGLPTLLTAFEQIAAESDDIDLVLVGGRDDAYLDAHLSGVARERVHLTGRVNDDQLRALYEGAALFAFPSLYEGFGLPPLEAMSLGTPVVVTNAASLSEVTGEAAIVFPAGDADALALAMRDVLDRPDRARQLSEAGRLHVKQFTLEAMTEATIRLYERVISHQEDSTL